MSILEETDTNVGKWNSTPTINCMMEVAIVGMLVLDLALTALFFSRHWHSSVPFVEHQRVGGEQVGDKEPASQTVAASSPSDVSSATFLLLRKRDIGGPEPYVSPSFNAQKWDYGGSKDTAQHWSDWSTTSGGPVDETYSYQNLLPNDHGPAT
jgi:hypothetical protein